jgi:hypothetical protein
MNLTNNHLKTITQRTWVREVGVYVWFVILALIMMGPVVTHFSRYAYSGPGDNLPGIYDLWWRHYAITHGLPVVRNSLLFYPLGHEVGPIYPYTLFFLMAKGLLLLTNEVALFNTLALVYLIGSGLGMYGLVKFLSGHRVAAVVAGSVYMWAPSQLIEAWGHLSWGPMWIPLVFLALFYYSDNPSWKRAILVGVLLTFALVDNPYYGYFVALMLPLYVFVYIVYHAMASTLNWRLVIQSAKHTAIVGGVVLLWFSVVYMVSMRDTISLHQTVSSEAVGDREPIMIFIAGSAFPWDYVTPSLIHPFLGWMNDRVFAYTTGLDVLFPIERFEGIPDEWMSWQKGARAQNYLGLSNLVLAGIGLWTWRKAPHLRTGRDIGLLFCLAVLLVAPWVSGPPMLPVGSIIQAITRIDLPLLDYLAIVSPSYWLYDIAPIVRAYFRIGILAVQSVIVLGGFGLAALLNRTRTHWQAALIASIVLLVGIFEFLHYPPPLVDVSDVETHYAAILADNEDYVIVDGFESPSIYAPASLAQRHHQKPLLDFIWWQYIVQTEDIDTMPVLSGLNIRYVIIRKIHSGQLERHVSSGQLRLVDSTEDAEVYQVLADPAPVMVYAETHIRATRIWQSQSSWTWSSESRTIYYLIDAPADLCLQAEVVSHPASLPFSPAFIAQPEDAALETIYEDGELLIRLAALTDGLYAIDLVPLADNADRLELDNIHFSQCEQTP